MFVTILTWQFFFLVPIPMDSKKVLIFAVLACVLLSVCIDQTSAQMGLRWGRELEDEWERAAQRPEYPWNKRGAQKKRGNSNALGVYYLIRTNFCGHLISPIWNANISRVLIIAIFEKIMNLGHLISRKLTKDRLAKPFLVEYL